MINRMEAIPQFTNRYTMYNNKAAADRRFNSNGRKYQIQQLWDSHHEILRLAILGYKHSEIAQELGVTVATVSNCLNSEIGRRHLELMRNARDAESIDLAVEIRNHAPKAFQLLKEFMANEGTPVKERIAIAMDNLDRAGYMPPKVVEGRFVHAHLSKQEIDELKQRAKESGVIQYSPDVDVDVEGDTIAIIE